MQMRSGIDRTCELSELVLLLMAEVPVVLGSCQCIEVLVLAITPVGSGLPCSALLGEGVPFCIPHKLWEGTRRPFMY